ncbi:MAG: hypothetical protein ACYC3P_04560 [Bellilinea sp.]
MYHDESREFGYWHGMYFVPKIKKRYLLDLLAKARNRANYYGNITFKNIKRPGPGYECKKTWMVLAALSLISRLGKTPSVVDWGKFPPENEERFEKLTEVIGAKFILFRDVNHFANMSTLLDFGGKVETTCRIGLKGGLHYLGSEFDPINIVKIHFDGHEHYRRNINRERLIGRLTGLRSYISVSNTIDLLDDRSSKPNADDPHDPEDCELLQLTDLIIGGFRSALIGQHNLLKKKVSYPMISLVERYSEGSARMRNSRWANSFCLSQCYLHSDKWHFDTIDIEENISNPQRPLPF